MYLHIGGDYLLSTKEIVGIFDFESTAEHTEDTLAFLQEAERQNLTEIVSPDIPRSYVVTSHRIYFSPISSTTLKKRLNQFLSEQL